MVQFKALSINIYKETTIYSFQSSIWYLKFKIKEFNIFEEINLDFKNHPAGTAAGFGGVEAAAGANPATAAAGAAAGFGAAAPG